jgi:iron(III) transport system substrate-binding protein
MLSTSCTNNEQLVLYSGQHPQLTDALVAAFQQQTGISVSVKTNDSIVLTQELLQEKSATPADVFLAENSPELMYLSQNSLLATLPPGTLSQVPSQNNSPAGQWVAMAIRVSCLVYNPALISSNQLPPSLMNLTDPAWSKKIAVAPSDSDFVPMITAVIVSKGEAAAKTWLQGLKQNAVTYQDIESVVLAVNHGDVAMGLINQYYWYRLQLQVGTSGMHSLIYYFPNGDVGTVANIAGAAITATTTHRPSAQKFVDFVVSPQGQQIVASGDDFEYPARADVPANSSLPPLSTIKTASITISQLGTDQLAAQLLRQVGFVSG